MMNGLHPRPSQSTNFNASRHFSRQIEFDEIRMSLEDMSEAHQKRLLEELDASKQLLQKEREEARAALAQLSAVAGDAAALKAQGEGLCSLSSVPLPRV